ncbi:MAG: hypothetical protein AB7S38_24230 [Vulcanimicrobiota bacterium]
MAIPTALFFVLIIFFLATVMAARAHMNLRLSRYEADGFKRQQAARGAAAQALIELNKDDNWKVHDSADRVIFERDPLVTEAWITQDPDHPLIMHIFGRAYPAGNEDMAEISSRVVLRRPDIEGVTFTNAPVFGRLTPDSMFYKRSYDTEWTKLPPCPRLTYSESGVLQTHSGYAGSLTNLAADDRGRLYAHYVPGYDRDDAIGDIYREKYARFLTTGDFGEMFRAVPDYVETLGSGLRAQAFGGSVIMTFDTANESWRALPPVPDVSFSGGTASLNTSRIYEGGVGPIEVSNDTLYVSIYKDGQDGMAMLDLNTETWQAIQPPPQSYFTSSGQRVDRPGLMQEAGNAEADSAGNLYANWLTGDRNNGAIFKKAPGGTWELLPPPEAGQFAEDGRWLPLGGKANKLSYLDVTPEGDVYATWNAHLDNSSLDYVVYHLDTDEDGVQSWEPVPPSPRFTYDDTGKVQRLTGRSSLLKAMAIDAEGQVIASMYETAGPDPLAHYYEGEFVPLPRLPDKRDRPDGTSVEDPDGYLEPFQADGGGYRNGLENRYIPIYRY